MAISIMSCSMMFSSFLGFQIFTMSIKKFQEDWSKKNKVTLITPRALLERKTDSSALWRMRNTMMSFFHSFIAGNCAIYCFYRNPQMAEDLISTFTLFDMALITFSTGYFIYDVLDMVVNHLGRSVFEILLHHVVVLICFSVALVGNLYVGYAVVSLLIEVNSVFLHVRQLLIFSGISKTSVLYRVNGIINLGTFIVFRMSILAWMTRWLVVHRERVPLLAYSIGALGLAVLTVVNIVLFWRLVKSDFIRSSRRDAIGGDGCGVPGSDKAD